MNIIVFSTAERILLNGYSHFERAFEAVEYIMQHKTKVYSYEEVRAIITAICSANDKRSIARKQHIHAIKMKYAHTS